MVDQIYPIVSTTKVLEIDIDYWGTHNLDFIPIHILERINELQKCKVLNPSVVEMFEVNKDFVESALKSRSLSLISTTMHPSFPSILSEFIKDHRSVLIIISNQLFSKLKEEWYEQFKDFIIDSRVKFYLYPSDLKVTTLAVSDSCFILRLFSKNNEFSNKQLICNDPRSYHWSKDLFDYYLKRSTLITEI